MISKGKRAAAAAVMAIAGLAAFAGDGLRAYFTPDDMMNLYGAWSASAVELAQGHRPLGALVYRALFALFGLHPLPFRVVCLGLLLANLVLLYAFCLRLTRSREAAVLTCVLGAYHAHLADLYYNSGTIYDLLSCFLVLLAFVFYMKIRQAGAYPNAKQVAILVGIYLCGLGAKEASVVLPPFVALYEWIFHAHRPYSWTALRPWLAHGAHFLYWSVPITLAFVLFRTMGGHAMTRVPAFTPDLSLHAFMMGWKHYLPDLFYGAIRFNSFKVILLLTLLLGLAALARRRDLLFAWCVIIVGMLPFIFIPPRGFYEVYLALPGWYLYAGSALVLARDGLLRHLPRLAGQFEVRPEQLALFAVVVLLLIPVHRHEKPLGNTWVAEAHESVRSVLERLAAEHHSLPRGAKVLFLSDPYEVDDWELTFIFRLYYRDKDIRVDRAKLRPEALVAEARAQYDRVYIFDERGLRESGEDPTGQ